MVFVDEMNTTFGRDHVILLLGAGASVEAGIPDSTSMVRRIGELVVKNSEWREFEQLFLYIRSAILFADGLRGIFGDKVLFNIERVVDVLDELGKKEGHVLYPFVGAWHQKLLDVAGPEFERVRRFREKIVDTLRTKWVDLPRNEQASYYAGLLRFQEKYQYSLRVFSLNYDLCVEKTCGLHRVQRGFADKTWDWRQFEETSEDPLPIILYKLHGSVDWYTDGDGRVKYYDSTSSISAENVALIFGRSYKLQYIDPFLFLVYELRRWTLDASRVIVCVGYGFGDEHINGILRQALRQNEERRLLAVVGTGGAEKERETKERICSLLGVGVGQVVTKASGAKEFLSGGLRVDTLAELFPVEEDLIGELSGGSG